ncbi:MAG: pseudouridine synthase [Owenweeksia sp.]
MQKKGSGKRPSGKPSFSRKPRPAGSKPSQKPSSDGLTRLNKYLAHSGIASRREADDLIKAGLVEVNGKTITEMGFKVKPTDQVKFNGSEVSQEKKVYIVLNKPKGFITTTDDPKARKTVMDLLGSAGGERFYPVGRLDRKTTGVLLFTNDGDLAEKLTHPSHGARKIYEVGLDKNLTKTDLHSIQKGLELEDGPIQVDEIQYIEGKSKNNIGVVLHSGRNRIVRRIFESLGYEVSKLDRVFFAGITKKNLNRGQWRYLSEKEVQFLKMSS